MYNILINNDNNFLQRRRILSLLARSLANSGGHAHTCPPLLLCFAFCGFPYLPSRQMHRRKRTPESINDITKQALTQTLNIYYRLKSANRVLQTGGVNFKNT